VVARATAWREPLFETGRGERPSRTGPALERRGAPARKPRQLASGRTIGAGMLQQIRLGRRGSRVMKGRGGRAGGIAGAVLVSSRANSEELLRESIPPCSVRPRTKDEWTRSCGGAFSFLELRRHDCGRSGLGPGHKEVAPLGPPKLARPGGEMDRKPDGGHSHSHAGGGLKACRIGMTLSRGMGRHANKPHLRRPLELHRPGSERS